MLLNQTWMLHVNKRFKFNKIVWMQIPRVLKNKELNACGNILSSNVQITIKLDIFGSLTKNTKIKIYMLVT